MRVRSERVRSARCSCHLRSRTAVTLGHACVPATCELGVARSGSRSRSGRVHSGKPRAAIFFLFDRYQKVRGVFDVLGAAQHFSKLSREAEFLGKACFPWKFFPKNA